ncbi:MAG: HupE/UreJ family protein [Planctomycetes bacterium]|nr:HupE/UreJ family protein [Planctomycetota bacterium]
MALLTLALLALVAIHAPAHTDTISYPVFTISETAIRLETRMKVSDLVGFVDFYALRDLEPGSPRPRPRHEDVLSQRFGLESLFLPGISVEADGRSLDSSLEAFETAPSTAEFPEDLVLRLSWTAPEPPKRLRITYRPLRQHDPRHQGLGRIRYGAVDDPFLFRADSVFDRELEPGAESLIRSAFDYGLLGMEHVFTGYDHLLFLAALLLAARRVREALLISTGFTAAHSITLALAALGWISLPASMVEPAIAASVVYVGIENCVRKESVGRVWTAAGFGLIHGLGFAGALAESGLPAGARAICLASFNLGVEAAQAIAIAIAMPLLLAWRARSASTYRRFAVLGGSAIIALAGVLWFATRVGGEFL